MTALQLVSGPLAWAAPPLPAAGFEAATHRAATVNLTDLARSRDSVGAATRSSQPAPMPRPAWQAIRGGGTRPGPMPAALQTGSAASGGAFTPFLSTNFMALIDNHLSNPPDTHGAAGPNHLMVTLNSEVAVQDRQGRTLLQTPLPSFWSNLGYSSLYDPRVVYDPMVDRWVTIVLAEPNTTNSALLIAASTSPDPTGNWSELAIPVNPAPGLTNGVWADYPNLGFNGRWVVVTVNCYSVASNSFVRAELFAFDQQRLFTGTFSFARLNDADFFTLVPASTMDPGETNLYFVTEFGTGNLRLSKLTGVVGQEQYNTNGLVTPDVPPWVFSPGDTNFAPQANSTVRISANDSRIQNVTFRNGSLWCAQTVFLPPGTNFNHSAIQWWQLATNATILQRGRIEDTNAVMNYAFPSIAVNRNNDALIGYSSFSSNQFAGANYSYRLGSDPTNTLRPDAVLKAGLAPFEGHAASTNPPAGGMQPQTHEEEPQAAGANRWGDFSATVVDPLNDTDLWTIQEYAEMPDSAGDRWGTWWGFFRFQSPTPPVNDSFANRLTLTGATATANGSNAEASLEPGEPQHAHLPGGRSVWWTWTAPESGPVTLSTEGSNFDTLLAVYTGSAATNLTEVASDDDSGTNLASRVTFVAHEGTSYPIAVDGYAGSEGRIHLSLVMNPPDLAPTVAWIGPTNGAAFIQSSTIALTANATDLDGAVTRVEFVNGKTELGVVTNAPYLLRWTNVPVGTYQLYARAWDDQGLGASSLPISLTVVPTNFPPVATIPSPTNGATYLAPATVTLEVDASDPDGSVTNVQLFAGSTKVAESSGAPALFSLTVPSPSLYVLTAVATDNQGATSAPVTVSFFVRPANDAFTNATPLTGVSAVTNGSNIQATKEPGEPNHAGSAGGQSVWWTWTAPTNGIATISTGGSSFDTLLGIYTGSSVTNLSLIASNDDRNASDPTSLATFNALGGTTYAIAVDGFRGTNGVVSSGIVKLSVALVPTNLPPTVSLLSPTNSSTFNAPANILLQATASGVGGPVTNVDFLVAATNRIAGFAAPPYSFTWTNVPAGTYILTARATDALGVTSTSSPVTVTVTPRPGRLAGGGFSADLPFGLTLAGEPMFKYGIEASTNLQSWTALTNIVVNSNGSIVFVDPASTNLRRRFYRAILNP